MPYVGRDAASFTTVVDVTVSDDLTVTDDASIGGNLTIDGTLSTATGIVHLGDTNTSLDFGADTQTFFSGAVKNLNLTTGGAVFNEDSADIDFRVESNGNANMLFVDGGNDAVGIGNNNPADYGALIDNLVVGTTSGNNGITIASGTDSGGRLCFADNTSSPQRGMIEYSHASDSMLFNANGSTRLKISSEGYVTQTNLPFLLGRGNDNTATRTLANNNLFFNTAQGSQVAMSITGSSSVTGGGSHGITYASGNGKFTVPVAGKYFIEGRLRYASATDAAVSVAINTNGNNALAYVILQCTEATTLVVSGVANLAANDFITFSNISGGDRVFFNADAHSGVSIFLIG